MREAGSRLQRFIAAISFPAVRFLRLRRDIIRISPNENINARIYFLNCCGLSATSDDARVPFLRLRRWWTNSRSVHYLVNGARADARRDARFPCRRTKRNRNWLMEDGPLFALLDSRLIAFLPTGLWTRRRRATLPSFSFVRVPPNSEFSNEKSQRVLTRSKNMERTQNDRNEGVRFQRTKLNGVRGMYNSCSLWEYDGKLDENGGCVCFTWTDLRGLRAPCQFRNLEA